MRSEEHTAYYQVGKWREHQAYWHPLLGYAVATEWGLRPMEDEAVDEIEWFTDQRMYEKIVSDVEESHDKLREAMDQRLLAAIDDIAFAEECELEKRLAFEEANRSLANQGRG